MRTRFSQVVNNSGYLPLYALALWLTAREVCLPEGGWRAIALTIAGALSIGVLEQFLRHWLSADNREFEDGAISMPGAIAIAGVLACVATLIQAGLFGLEIGFMELTVGTPLSQLVVVPFLVIGAIYGLVTLEMVIGDMTRRAELIEKSQRAREHQAMQAQLDSHFVMNTITAVLPEVSEADGSVRHLLEHMASYFQYSLRNRHRTQVSMGEEFDAACEYLQLELTRFSERLSLELHIDDAAREIMVPPMLLHPLVENAVKYGSMSMGNGGAFRVVLRVNQTDDGRAVVLVANTAPARRQVAVRGTGFGLEYVASRLAQTPPRYFSLKVSRSWAVAKIVWEPLVFAT